MYTKSFSLLALAAMAQAQSQNLTATLAGSSDLSNLTTFLSADPSLLASLANATNVTILALNNAAFAKLLSSSAGAALGSNAGALAAVLTYHVLNGTYPASAFTNKSAFVPTILKNQTFANVTGGQVVDGVVVGNETVIYSGLLQNSTVTQANINFTGGIVHIIDSVLTLPEDVLSTTLAFNLTSLRGAVNATGLASAINNTPDLTIFAPNNEAFTRIGSALQNASTDDLKSILSYHVVNGTVGYSSKLSDGQKLTALDGKELTVTIRNGNVFVNGAKVITPDVLVANGVVHVIDNVLNPSSTSGPASSATTGAPAYGSATAVGSGAPFTSGQPTATTTVNPSSARPAATSSSASKAAAMPQMTGSMGYGALLGAGAALAFL